MDVFECVGDFYFTRRRYDKALGYYRLAFKNIEVVGGIESADAARMYLAIGNTIRCLGQEKEGEEHILKAIEIFENNPDEELDAYAAALSNLGTVYGERGEHKKGVKMLEQAIMIIEEMDADREEILRGCLECLQDSYEGLGDYEKAIAISQRLETWDKG